MPLVRIPLLKGLEQGVSRREVAPGFLLTLDNFISTKVAQLEQRPGLKQEVETQSRVVRVYPEGNALMSTSHGASGGPTDGNLRYWVRDPEGQWVASELESASGLVGYYEGEIPLVSKMRRDVLGSWDGLLHSSICVTEQYLAVAVSSTTSAGLWTQLLVFNRLTFSLLYESERWDGYTKPMLVQDGTSWCVFAVLHTAREVRCWRTTSFTNLAGSWTVIQTVSNADCSYTMSWPTAGNYWYLLAAEYSGGELYLIQFLKSTLALNDWAVIDTGVDGLRSLALSSDGLSACALQLKSGSYHVMYHRYTDALVKVCGPVNLNTFSSINQSVVGFGASDISGYEQVYLGRLVDDLPTVASFDDGLVAPILLVYEVRLADGAVLDQTAQGQEPSTTAGFPVTGAISYTGTGYAKNLIFLAHPTGLVLTQIQSRQAWPIPVATAPPFASSWWDEILLPNDSGPSVVITQRSILSSVCGYGSRSYAVIVESAGKKCVVYSWEMNSEQVGLSCREALVGARAINGGLPASLLHGQVIEHVPLQIPVLLAQAGAEGSVPIGTYQYEAVYQITDAEGRVGWSAPSLPVTVDVSTPSDVNIAVTPLYLSRVPPKGKLDILVYRSDSGAPYQLVTTLANVRETDTGYMPVEYTDTAASVSANAVLYTEGGKVPNFSAPFLGAMVRYRNRLFGFSDDRLWYSQVFYTGQLPEWNDIFYITTRQRVTAISTCAEILVVFFEDSIDYLTGDGPDSTGAGAWSAFNSVSSTVGCPESLGGQNSIVSVESAVFFRSQRGIERVAFGSAELNSATQLLSEPVRDTLLSYPVVVESTHWAERNVVVWLLRKADSEYYPDASGNYARACIAYDLTHKVWYTWSSTSISRAGCLACIDSELVLGIRENVDAASYGGIWRTDPSQVADTYCEEGTDVEPITCTLALHDLKFFGESGRGYVRSVEWQGIMQLDSRLAMALICDDYTYQATPLDLFTPTWGNGEDLKLNHKVHRPLLSRISVAIAQYGVNMSGEENLGNLTPKWSSVVLDIQPVKASRSPRPRENW